MQYMLMVHADQGAFASMPPAQMQQGMAAYTAYTEALKAAGALVNSNRLADTSTATTIRVRDGKAKLVNGPYAESKEQLGGYYLIEAKDLDAALNWAEKCPGAHHGAVEVRPIAQM